ncbi:alpha/beta hydrolase [Micromonospora sp. C28SCA-DRY-2]|uniref:alpha/beta fold hydrolase n=1 Tax=Micromonospora sp. C28SCA-DRY-2 TaxID=3059522 RepID=UPI00267596E4|nr:alpha/beta hydrolase [Micromonospora sp. C28SCA-DRY-2]MDO3703631.1 alpha/beta hydrolase [Micromonospora sp. C28SCA-DRY-2]
MSDANQAVETVRSADGTPIAHERFGDGPPIILIGGAFNDRSTIRALAEALAAAGFTAFAYDRRGRGDSGDTPPYQVRREIEDVAALVEAAGGKAHLYGLSSGAILAAYATAHGLPVSGLVMFEPPFQVGPHAGSRPDISARTAELIAAGDRAGAVEHFMVTAVGLPAEAVAGMRAEPMWPFLESMAHTLPYDGLISGDGSLPVDRLAGIGVPTLVVESTASPQWLRDGARATAEAIPGARHVGLPGGFHEVPADTLAAEIRRFLLG